MRMLPVLLIAALFCPMSTFATARAETITLAADEWAPFNSVPNIQPEGYMVDVVREIFKSHGIEVVYHMVPWQRALEGSRKGEYTAAVGPTRDEAPYLIFPKEELARNRLSIWVKKGNRWRFTTRNSIESISLGVIEGYDYRKWLNTYTKKNRNDRTKIQFVAGAKPMEMNIDKLLAGRIDAVVDNEAVIRYTAKRLGVLDRLELAGHDSELAFCYVAFSPANPRSSEYARILSDGITKMRKNGRLKQILDVYGLKDWKDQ